MIRGWLHGWRRKWTSQLGACGGTCDDWVGPLGFLGGASNVTIDRSFQLVVCPGESHMFPYQGSESSWVLLEPAQQGGWGSREGWGSCWWVQFDLILLFPAQCLPPSLSAGWHFLVQALYSSVSSDCKPISPGLRGGNYTSVWFDEDVWGLKILSALYLF